MPLDNKYNLGDEVAFEGKLWRISGVVAHVGYDLKLWTYWLTQGLYTDSLEPGSWGGRVDVVTKKEVREDQLLTLAEHRQQKLQALEAAERQAQKDIEILRAQIAAAKDS